MEDKEKPENCTCGYPSQICRNLSMHRPDCPVHIEFMKKHFPVELPVFGMEQEIAQAVHKSFTAIATVKHGDIAKFVFDELETRGGVAYGYVSALALKAVLEKLEQEWNQKIINQQG